MRPKTTVSAEGVYECFECGQHVTEPDTRSCADCGAQLRHISKPRDL